MSNLPLKYSIFEHIYHLSCLKSIKLMSIKITYINKSSFQSPANTVLFVDEKFNLNNTRKYLSANEFVYIKDLLKVSDNKKKYLFLN